MSGFIAEERLIGLRPSGERLEVVAGVGRPCAINQNEWTCPVVLTGVCEIRRNVHGGSSLQSLCLATSLLRQMLTYFLEDGGKLYYADGDTVFDMAACFSGVGANGDA